MRRYFNAFVGISKIVHIYAFLSTFPGKQGLKGNHFPEKHITRNGKHISVLCSLIISLFMCLCCSRLFSFFHFQFSLLFSRLYSSRVREYEELFTGKLQSQIEMELRVRGWV